MLYVFLAVIIILLAAILGEGAYIAMMISGRQRRKDNSIIGELPNHKSEDREKNPEQSKEKEQIERFLKYSG